MNKKRLHIGLGILAALIVGVFGVRPASAETVSQKWAMQVAQTFFNTMYGQSTGRPKLVWNGRELTTNRLFTPFYVYNSPKGGFVAISADSKAFPVLAYSRNHKFDKGDIRDAEHEQFERYAREMELIRYDSRLPKRAMEAWSNLPQYITDVLNNPYATPEYRRLTAEAQDALEQMDRRNSWIIMPTAIEFDLYRPEQYRDYTLDDVTAEPEEVPFSFYEDFLSEIAEEERTRAAAYDEILIPTHPKIQYGGGGHYTILLPEEASLMRVYDVSGTRTQERRFRGTNSMLLDLSGMPAGYYIVLALSREGNIYAFKLHR